MTHELINYASPPLLSPLFPLLLMLSEDPYQTKILFNLILFYTTHTLLAPVLQMFKTFWRGGREKMFQFWSWMTILFYYNYFSNYNYPHTLRCNLLLEDVVDLVYIYLYYCILYLYWLISNITSMEMIPVINYFCKKSWVLLVSLLHIWSTRSWLTRVRSFTSP